MSSTGVLVSCGYLNGRHGPSGEQLGFIEAIDNAGNVTIANGKGTLFALSKLALPIIRR